MACIRLARSTTHGRRERWMRRLPHCDATSLFCSYHPSPVPSTAPPARFVCVIFFVKGAGVSAGSIQTCCSVAHFVPISQERNVRAQWHDCQKRATRRAASATPPRPIQRSRTAGALHAGGKTSILSQLLAAAPCTTSLGVSRQRVSPALPDRVDRCGRDVLDAEAVRRRPSDDFDGSLALCCCGRGTGHG